MVSLALQFITAGLFFALRATAAVTNTIYVIPNAEIPGLGLPGLNEVGSKRAHDCLPPLLQPLNIGLVVACDPDSSDDDIQYCPAAVATVKPTADALQLPIDTTCSTEDDDCLNFLIHDFAQTSNKSVLIAWDALSLDDVLDDLDVDDDNIENFWKNPEQAEDIDDENLTNDLLFTIQKRNITGLVSQGCEGIDGQAPGTYRRSLMPRYMRERQPHKRQVATHKMMSRSRIARRMF